MFTKLKILSLVELLSLKSFCKSHCSEKEETSEKGIPKIQALFNRKVAIPMLEELTLYEGNLFEHIWNAEIPASSSSKLRVLTVTGNDSEYDFPWSFSSTQRVLEVTRSSKLVNFPPNLLQRFEAVEQLTLSYCLSLEAVVGFNREELNAIVRQEFMVFNNLTTLDIYCCESLRYLFSLSIATTWDAIY
ncbi:uncharacterized protein LOC132284773 [Cornus florida]|uniref:uncharacterized protein LOC132284773 n=1 Tax=Cornus florida TaxID=4283 RepID=UPI0028A00F27|nr:uncharacterized protein LOC132284773 [Cornus florida]